MYILIYICIYNAIKYYTPLYHLNICNVYICIIKNKVKLGGIEFSFKNNSFGKKNNY